MKQFKRLIYLFGEFEILLSCVWTKYFNNAEKLKC